jgi:2'-5' RNA ligase
MKNYYGCWMHLSKKDNKFLSPIIYRLSKKYVNGDIFPPHISVSSYAQIELDEAISSAVKCVEGMKKFEVEQDSIKYSDMWHKTLYIQLKNNPDLIKINNFLNKTFGESQPPYLFNPHISLLYKEGLDMKEKDHLAKKIKVPNKYLVSSLAVVTSENKNDTRDYGSWKVVFEKELK